MVDQLIRDAQTKLRDFAHAWTKRAQEFHNMEEYTNASDAYGLAKTALTKTKNLHPLLEEDKRLDKAYDDMKKKAIA